jgi:hypothetical protein
MSEFIDGFALQWKLVSKDLEILNPLPYNFGGEYLGKTDTSCNRLELNFGEAIAWVA